MFHKSNFFLAAGVCVILLGTGNAYRTYEINHSPLDMVVESTQQLDKNNQYIPLLQTTDGIPAAKIEDPSGSLFTKRAARLNVETDTTQSPMAGLKPDRIVIPAINLDAPVESVHYVHVILDGQKYEEWVVPNHFAAGWQDESALLGVTGNTVLNGHHNAYGKVFQNLINLNIGDTITVYSGDQTFEYRIAAKMLLPERYQSIQLRLNNARWIMPSTDERLTLVTCWPPDSNTHRVVIVAFPIK